MPNRNPTRTPAGLPILLAVMVLLLPASPANSAPCTLDIGSPAPLLSGVDILGHSQELTELRGKWVYIDFWATWCKPCLRKLPGVVDLQEEMGQRSDFTVLSVSLDQAESEDKIREVADEYGVRFPVVYDGDGWLSDNARNWCVDAIPATFLVDPQGRLVARDLSTEQARQMVAGADSPSYRPLMVAVTEALLPDSRTTGLDTMRDLQLTVDMLPGSPAVNSYQLQVMFVREPGAAEAELLAYAMDVWLAPTASSEPSRIDLRPLQAENGDSAWASIAPNQSVITIDPRSHPSISAAVDPATRTYSFLLPLPSSCTEIAYRLSLFNETLGQYVSNGVRRTRLAPGSSAY